MFRSPFSLYPFAVEFLLLAASSLAQPGFLVEPSDFIEQTELIFVGSLVGQESFWTSDGMILTEYTFEVQRAVKGTSGTHVQITEYGGEVGDIIHQVSHSARYSTGRTYLIFSYRGQEGRLRTLAGPLGRLPLVERPNGEDLVRLSQEHPLSRMFHEPKVFRELGSLEGKIRDAMRRTGVQ